MVRLPTKKKNKSDWQAQSTDTQWLSKLGKGEIIFDHYRIVGRKLGGTAVVFLVVDERSGQRFAIKTPQITDRTSAIDFQEGRDEILFWINLPEHENIVRALSVLTQNERPFLLLEFVPASLADEIARGALGENRALDVARDVCLGLEAANTHSDAPLAHLDLKPGNIMIDENGRGKVTDFGSAYKLQRMAQNFPTAFRSTAPYAAPELYEQKPGDTRSDIYSIGVIMFEMLVGENQYPHKLELAADDSEWLHQFKTFHLSRFERRSLGLSTLYDESLPATQAFRQILSTCLSERAHRYPGFRELRDAIERIIEPADISSTFSTPQTDTFQDLHRLAIELEKNRCYSEALKKYNRLLSSVQGRQSGRLWLDAGRVALANNDPTQSRQLFAQARHLDPSLGAEIEQLQTKDVQG